MGNWFTIYNIEYISLAMKIVDEGPLNVSCLFFLIDGEQMLTFFHKNSVSYELERKKWALTLQYGAIVTVLSWDSLNWRAFSSTWTSD